MREGTLLWEPTDPSATRLARFMSARGFSDYHDLWRWSVEDLEGFWGSLWDWFGIGGAYERVLARREMPGAEWFPGAELNYAEHVFRPARPGATAIVHASESQPLSEITWDELREQVARCAAGLRRLGVRRGDRVVAYMPNVPETVVALLATASLGAVWSSCATEWPRSAPPSPRSSTPSWSLATGSASWTSRPSSPSSTSASTTRSGFSTRRARPACRRRSCRVTAASC